MISPCSARYQCWLDNQRYKIRNPHDYSVWTMNFRTGYGLIWWWFDDWNLRLGPFPVKPWHWHPEITSFKPGNGCVSSNHHLWNISSSFLLVNWFFFTVGKGRIIGGRIILFLGCLLQPVYLCISISNDYNTISMIKSIINPHITAPYPVLDEIPLWSSQLG